MPAPARKCGSDTERDDRGRFGPGNAGKPRGTPNRATRAAQALLDGEAEALSRKAVDLALGGDPTALRLCLERIAPPRTDAPVTFDLPEMTSAADAAEVMSSVVVAVAAGDLTPGEGATVAGLVETFRRTLETTELKARVATLEESDRRAR